jgi:drug/metabolite transporter (DMT)-like permease
MSRIKADLLLLLVAIVWGAAFIAQKDSLASVGPFTFLAARFFISLVLVLPLAIREYKLNLPVKKLLSSKGELFLMCATFCGGMILQQIGIGKTTVTNAGFLTGLYVIFVPVLCTFIYKQKLSRWNYIAALTSIAGVWLLSGAMLDGFSFGDALIFACSIVFSIQVTLLGRVAVRLKTPFIIPVLQYAVIMLVAATGMIFFEHPTFENIRAATWPILFAGVLSGAFAYTAQVIAQQYTTAADSAIIMSGEAVFAAIGGALMLGERLTPSQYYGCALISAAIALTEVVPLLFRKKKSS